MSATQSEALRTAAAAAALVLAVLSRGDVLVLAALLVIAAWRPWALAVVPAMLASAWRWGSTSLDALAGAQAVLGPAGFVGPAAAAAASWLAAAAVLASVPAARVGGMDVPNRDADAPNLVLGPLAVGAAAAAIVAGPAAGGELWIRLVATVVAAAAALAIARLRASRPRAGRAIDVVGVVAAGGALGAVIPNAPGWAGTFERHALTQGIVLAVAAATLITVWGLTRAAMRQQRA